MARRTSVAANSYLSRTGAAVVVPPLTLSLWVKATTAAQFAACLCVSATNGWFSLGSLATDLPKATSYEFDGSNVGVAKSIAIPSATWVHLAGVFPTHNARSVFVNGANKVVDATSTFGPAINKTMVGTAMVGGAVYGTSWDGDLAEFAVYNAALSDADVALLASGQSAALVQPASLAAYYKLLGTSDPEPDEKGGTALTLTGSPAAAPHPPIVYGLTGGRMFAVF